MLSNLQIIESGYLYIMSYQVLARKWRPKAFDEVVGQEHVLKVLSNALSLGRVHHAYLFSGTRGVGKTSIARLLAKGLNCEQGITATPCGQCDNCQDIEQGRFVDLLEIDAASRTKVEDTREILDNIQYLPTKGRFKVYLIDEVHMLSRSSFNALLKTLEEPPEHVKFLLATTDPQKLPITILSRCLHLHLNVLDNELISKQLVKILQTEKIDSESKAINLLAKAANGSMRDALSLTDQAIALGNGQVDASSVAQMLGTLDKAIPFSLVEALYKGDGNALMQHIESAAKQGADWDSLLIETITLLHQIALLQIVPTAVGDYSDNEERIRYLAQYISPNDIQLFYQILLMGRKELAHAPDKKIGVEMSFLRALAFTPKSLDVQKKSPNNVAGNVVNHNVTADVVTPNVVPSVTTESISASSPQSAQASSLPTSTAADEKQVTTREHAEPPTTVPLVNPDEPKIIIPTAPIPSPAASGKIAPAKPLTSDEISAITKNILAVRQQLIESEQTVKKSEKVDGEQPTAKQISPKLATVVTTNTAKIVASNKQDRSQEDTELADSEQSSTAETYQWQFSEHFTASSEPALNAKAVRLALEHEKTPELTRVLIEEATKVDAWSAEVEVLAVPPLVKQLAVNAYLEQVNEHKLVLHLRSGLRHLAKAANNINKLTEALTANRGQQIELSIIIDDDKTNLTPLEIREKIYQSKLQQAKETIYHDDKVAMICQLFEAQIDESSIRPV